MMQPCRSGPSRLPCLFLNGAPEFPGAMPGGRAWHRTNDMSGHRSRSSSTPAMPEPGTIPERVRIQRASERRRVLKSAIAGFCNRYCSIPCTVRDISDHGARLRCEGSVNLPDHFDLIIDLDGIEVQCEVIWRNRNEIGVRFVETPRKAQPRRQQVVEPVIPNARILLRSRSFSR